MTFIDAPIVILGPTASGKTTLACALAYDLNGYVISADSRQVYKELNIGSGKDLEEYKINGTAIPYELIDVTDLHSEYDIAQFQLDTLKAVQRRPSQKAIICGGSGMYLESILRGKPFAFIPNPENKVQALKQWSDAKLIQEASKSDLVKEGKLKADTRKRQIRAIIIHEYLKSAPLPSAPVTSKNPILFGLNPPIKVRRERITQRLKVRIENGLLEEVEHLLNTFPESRITRLGLEYFYGCKYLQKEMDEITFFSQLNTAIHQFAKRQMTWFRGMEKRGYKIHWVPDTTKEQQLEWIKIKSNEISR